MSRSHKKPYCSTTCIGERAGMMKWWKSMVNRKLRRVQDDELVSGGHYKKVLGHSSWDAPKDGKHYWDDPKGKRK